MQKEQQLVFLVGYRGTGKSTVARHLAERLGWDCADADVHLEQRFGRSISQIFADEGEGGFRDKEAAVLDDLVQLNKHVVALGGGVILRPENREKLHCGKVVWLTAPAEVLWQRLQADTSTLHRRPNLGQGGLAEVEEMLRLRAPLYKECADLQVDTAKQGPEEVAAAIFQWLRK